MDTVKLEESICEAVNVIEQLSSELVGILERSRQTPLSKQLRTARAVGIQTHADDVTARLLENFLGKEDK